MVCLYTCVQYTADYQDVTDLPITDSEMLKLSEYSEALPKLEKERYKQKLVEIKCNIDPYVDSDSYSCGPVHVPVS